jgi:hypothetical protein
MKATNKSTVFILAFMNFLMEMNKKKGSEIHYMDSTPITVCQNHKIYSHKVTKGIARKTCVDVPVKKVSAKSTPVISKGIIAPARPPIRLPLTQ